MNIFAYSCMPYFSSVLKKEHTQEICVVGPIMFFFVLFSRARLLMLAIYIFREASVDGSHMLHLESNSSKTSKQTMELKALPSYVLDTVCTNAFQLPLVSH